jgi:hypothetical protein
MIKAFIKGRFTANFAIQRLFVQQLAIRNLIANGAHSSDCAFGLHDTRISKGTMKKTELLPMAEWTFFDHHLSLLIEKSREECSAPL